MKISLRTKISLGFNYYSDKECRNAVHFSTSVGGRRVEPGEIVELIKLTDREFYLYVPEKKHYASARPMIGLDRALAEWFEKTTSPCKIWRAL